MYQALEQTRKKLASDEGETNIRKEPESKGPFHRESGAELAAVKIPGLEKTHLQEVATATAINIVRAVNFLNLKPLAKQEFPGFKISK
jgi:hypothetical protein